MNTDEQESNGHKNQRAYTPEADDASMHSPTNLTSPKGKRNRAQFLQDDEDQSPQSMTAPKNTLITEPKEPVSEDSKFTSEGERSPKRQRSGSPKPKGLETASGNIAAKVLGSGIENGTENGKKKATGKSIDTASEKSTDKVSDPAKDSAKVRKSFYHYAL
jgi:hypothetical protein